jgi:hypothetical protein
MQDALPLPLQEIQAFKKQLQRMGKKSKVGRRRGCSSWRALPPPLLLLLLLIPDAAQRAALVPRVQAFPSQGPFIPAGRAGGTGLAQLSRPGPLAPCADARAAPPACLPASPAGRACQDDG